MRLVTVLQFLFLLVILSACSKSYDELSNNSYNHLTEFSKYLLDSYKEKADFEAKKMHDWNSTKLYSEKALKAASGVKIKPEKITFWKIKNNKINELAKAHTNLMTIYNDAIVSDPYNLAVAISSLDCWAEQQEENWQQLHIEKCKNDYLNAMHNIYDLLAKDEKKDEDKINNKKIESESIITKNQDNEILQIIYFDFDKSSLTNVSYNLINKFIEKNRSKTKKYLVVGHTDTKGTQKYNMRLSLERAFVIKKNLIDLGINKEKIKILGKGETALRVKTYDDVPHPANRRAEIKAIN